MDPVQRRLNPSQSINFVGLRHNPRHNPPPSWRHLVGDEAFVSGNRMVERGGSSPGATQLAGRVRDEMFKVSSHAIRRRVMHPHRFVTVYAAALRRVVIYDLLGSENPPSSAQVGLTRGHPWLARFSRERRQGLKLRHQPILLSSCVITKRRGRCSALA